LRLPSEIFRESGKFPAKNPISDLNMIVRGAHGYLQPMERL